MIVSPSLLAADFLNLGKEIEMINQSEADWLHLDIMDGLFVPNISYGFSVIEPVSKVCRKPLDVHFMTMHPELYIRKTAELGAMMMNVHYEATHQNISHIVEDIHKAGMKAGVTVSPETPVARLENIARDVDMVLIMGVNPGFGAQKLFETTYGKIELLREVLDKANSKALIEVDGGVNGTNVAKLASAGADIIVSGSYIFKSPDPNQTIKDIKKL